MADAFTKEAFSLLGVGVVVVTLRTYTRWTLVGIRQFMLDDYLMLLALVVYGLETGAAYSVGAMFHGKANDSMTDDERKALSPDSEDYALRVGGSKLQLIGWSLYTLLLWLLKLCMCIFYTRLTTGLRHMQIRIRIGFVFIGLTYVTTITAILAGCGAPFRKNWQIYPDPGNHCQPAISKFDLFFTMVLNVVTDMYLLSIPLPLFWKAQIDPKRKAWLLFMFSGGIFVTIAAILRCVLILTGGANGAQLAGSWAVRETFVAVVIGNIPMIQPLFTSAAKKLGSIRTNFSSQRSGPRSDGHSTIISLKNMVKSPRKQPRTAHPLSVSSSAEHIIEARYQKDLNKSASSARVSETKNGIHVTNETTVESEAVKDSSKQFGIVGSSHCNVSA